MPKPLAISVVIPTFKRDKYLHWVLFDLSRQAHVDFEVIVIYQAQPIMDGIELLSCKPRVYLADEPNASLARNIGLLEARNEIVLFLDDDVRVADPHFLSKHLRNYDDPTVPGVYGQVLECGQHPIDRPAPEMIETSWGWMLLPPNYAQRCRTRNGGAGNLSIRRDWAMAVGGMDAHFEKGARREETEFNLRYTQRYGPLVFDPEASLIHLSADGGSRAEGHVVRTVPLHHIVGHWYFLLAALRDRSMCWRGFGLELRHIAVALLRNPTAGRGILGFAWNTIRALYGLVLAFMKFASGPRRMSTLKNEDYCGVIVAKTKSPPG